MHAARHGWDLEKDAPLFMRWAIHTGTQLLFFFFNSSFTNYDVIYKLHFIIKCLLVCFQDRSFIKHQTLQKSQITATGIGNSLVYHFMFYPETTQQHNECV